MQNRISSEENTIEDQFFKAQKQGQIGFISLWILYSGIDVELGNCLRNSLTTIQQTCPINPVRQPPSQRPLSHSTPLKTLPHRNPLGILTLEALSAIHSERRSSRRCKIWHYQRRTEDRYGYMVLSIALRHCFALIYLKSIPRACPSSHPAPQSTASEARDLFFTH